MEQLYSLRPIREFTTCFDVGLTPGFFKSNIERIWALSPSFLRVAVSTKTLIASLEPSSVQAANAFVAGRAIRATVIVIRAESFFIGTVFLLVSIANVLVNHSKRLEPIFVW